MMIDDAVESSTHGHSSWCKGVGEMWGAGQALRNSLSLMASELIDNEHSRSRLVGTARLHEETLRNDGECKDVGLDRVPVHAVSAFFPSL